jgi:hypothetical protein
MKIIKYEYVMIITLDNLNGLLKDTHYNLKFNPQIYPGIEEGEQLFICVLLIDMVDDGVNND